MSSRALNPLRTHMFYLINNEITFRTDDGVIASLSLPEHSVVLSVTAKRIFTYLLEQRGKVVSRDELFVNVWDKNGFQASNNSLSQYISLIRRVLLDFGCLQEVIQTIPRVGFLIPENLISVSEPDKSEPDRPLELEMATLPDNLSARVKYLVTGMLLVSLAIVLFPSGILKGSPTSTLNTAKTWKLGDIGMCPVYTFTSNSPEMTAVKLEQARNLTNMYLGCIEGATYYFQPDDAYVYRESGRAFLSRCTWINGKNSTFAGCKDIYINEN